MSDTDRLHIDLMTFQDLQEVHQIETAANQFPWSLKNFEDSLNAGYQGWVGRIGQQMTAYAIVQNILDEAHLLNLCVAPAHQSKGLGAKLLRHVLMTAQQRDAALVVLEVRQSNTRAQQLYLNAGFNEMSIRYGYYPAEKGRENAILMGMNLNWADDGFAFSGQ